MCAVIVTSTLCQQAALFSQDDWKQVPFLHLTTGLLRCCTGSRALPPDWLITATIGFDSAIDSRSRNRQLEGGATERAKSNKYVIAARLFSYAAHGFKLGGNFHLNCVSLRLAAALRSTCSKGNVTNTSSASEASRDWSWNSRWIRIRIEILCLTG